MTLTGVNPSVVDENQAIKLYYLFVWLSCLGALVLDQDSIVQDAVQFGRQTM